MMSSEQMSQLIERLRALSGCQFGRGASPREIKRAEKTLGVSLPPSYRIFLRTVGWVDVEAWEIFGLGQDVPPHLDLVRITLSEREEVEPPMPHHLIPFQADGAGNHYCLDTSEIAGEDCPVVFWDHELADYDLWAESFTIWLGDFLNMVEAYQAGGAG